MHFSLNHIKQQLKKRWKYPYKWYKKQNDHWDTHTRFIYEIKEWDPLVKAIAKVVSISKMDKEQLFYYAINRWYNFWSSIAVEQMFCDLKDIVPVKDPKDKEVDFYIQKIPFDHKTSVFPNGFGKNFAFAKANNAQLIRWLYRNQSLQGRKHLANRLFIIVYKNNGRHWKLKAEFSLLQPAISNYVATFEPGQLTKIEFPENKETFSDIIWVAQ